MTQHDDQMTRLQRLHAETILSVDSAARADLMQQAPCVLWFTGISAAGKSTVANLVDRELHRRGHHTYLLDGDKVRHGLSRDLGFTDTDRTENIRRVAEVAKLMLDSGLIVLVALISPFRSGREMARSLFEPSQFFEIHVDTPLEVAQQRDPKGLYRQANRGELHNVSGMDSPYEIPESPEVHIVTTELSRDECAQRVLDALDAARGA